VGDHIKCRFSRKTRVALPNSVPRYDEGSDRAIVLQFCTNSEAEAGTIS
jgi:hypothetical protein